MCFILAELGFGVTREECWTVGRRRGTVTDEGHDDGGAKFQVGGRRPGSKEWVLGH